MALNKIRLGKYIELYTKQCGIADLKNEDISGINKEKEFFEPSPQVGEDTSKYKVVPPKFYACNLMHVGRDKVLPIAFNHTEENKIVSPAYFVFRFKENEEILSEYFFIFLKSEERDRYFWFNTDSSVRDGMTWDDFVNVEIEIPSIEIQKKYVNIYKNILENQKSYENGVDDLKLTCDATIENLKKKFELKELEKYIIRYDERNKDNSIKNVKGVSTTKEFREPTSKVNKSELSTYKIVHPGDISFVQTTHNEKVFANAINNTDEDIIVTSVNEVFKTNKDYLLSEFLVMYFNRKEFDRYARYHSWGSARETFTWNDLIQVKIPLPDLKEQKNIVDIYNIYNMRKQINTILKEQIRRICPVLIRGAIKEGENNND